MMTLIVIGAIAVSALVIVMLCMGTDAAPEKEAGMEDILSSIRDIIDEDDGRSHKT